jgi:predicted nuclease with TOPRIM domain
MNSSALTAAGDPGATEYYQYFVITAAILVAFKHTLDLWKAHLRAPDPVPPLHKEYASRENLADLDDRLDALIADFERKADDNHRTSAASREKVYESVRALERGVAALQKETELLTQRLHHLDAKLDRLIERGTRNSEC